MFSIGQRVIINYRAFKGIKGVILDIGGGYYRVQFDYIVLGYENALFKEEELELCGPENIMDYLKHKLLEDM